MGTRGYWAYRSGGWYFVYYNHWDSYPSGLGYEVAGKIPRQAEAFKAWKTEETARLAELRKETPLDAEFTLDFSIQKEAPQNDLFIEWTYVIDLDNNTFVVDDGAHFRLDNLPEDGEVWEAYLDLDEDGRRCLSPSTPAEYVAHRTVQPSPVLADNLNAYAELKCIPLDVSPQFPNVAEDLVQAISEISLNACLAVASVQEAKAKSKAARSIVATLLGPITSLFTDQHLLSKWPADVKCLFRQHLGHPDVLKQIVAKIGSSQDIQHAVRDGKPVVILVFSIMHVVLIEMSRDAVGSSQPAEDGLIVKHTEAIPFLTDIAYRRFSTEGLRAFIWAAEKMRLVSISDTTSVAAVEIGFDALPAEIKQSIFERLGIDSLNFCARVSKSWRSICSPILDLPVVPGFRILGFLSWNTDRRIAAFSCVQMEGSIDERFIMLVVPHQIEHRIWERVTLPRKTLDALLEMQTFGVCHRFAPLRALVFTEAQYRSARLQQALAECAPYQPPKIIGKEDEDEDAIRTRY